MKGKLLLVSMAIAMLVGVGGCAQIAPFHHAVGDTFDKFADNQDSGVVKKAAQFGGWGWHLTGNLADKVLGGGAAPANTAAVQADTPANTPKGRK